MQFSSINLYHWITLRAVKKNSKDSSYLIFLRYYICHAESAILWNIYRYLYFDQSLFNTWVLSLLLYESQWVQIHCSTRLIFNYFFLFLHFWKLSICNRSISQWINISHQWLRTTDQTPSKQNLTKKEKRKEKGREKRIHKSQICHVTLASRREH